MKRRIKRGEEGTMKWRIEKGEGRGGKKRRELEGLKM